MYYAPPYIHTPMHPPPYHPTATPTPIHTPIYTPYKGRAKSCGMYKDGTTAWSPAGKVVYDAEDYRIFDNEVCIMGCV